MEQPSTPDSRSDLEQARDTYQENLRLVLELLDYTDQDQRNAEAAVHTLHNEQEQIAAVIEHLQETEPTWGEDAVLIAALQNLLEVTRARKQAYERSTHRTDQDQVLLEGAARQWDALHQTIQAFLSNKNRTGRISLQ